MSYAAFLRTNTSQLPMEGLEFSVSRLSARTEGSEFRESGFQAVLDLILQYLGT